MSRFAPPVPPNPWDGIKKCSSSESPMCLQSNILSPETKFLIQGSEDCLYLNVYTTRLPNVESGEKKNQEKLPVIVWFHGITSFFKNHQFPVSVNSSFQIKVAPLPLGTTTARYTAPTRSSTLALTASYLSPCTTDSDRLDSSHSKMHKHRETWVCMTRY